MALLAWSSKYSVGVTEMDRQHRVLFDILNDLQSAMLNGTARNATAQLLRSLTEYTRKHFVAEETMLAAAGYPELTQHRLKHRELIRQVEEHVTRFQRGELSVNIQLLTFLRDWISTHIQQTDRQYTTCALTYLSARGRGAA